uniref:Uncharacterized protein n=1 Tax=Meloidogyne enterolobii TaxID=390850 RepID=A0A6V7UGC2_MELEN|nr:unnamed protein product [Meloidogyne enterolobii]
MIVLIFLFVLSIRRIGYLRLHNILRLPIIIYKTIIIYLNLVKQKQLWHKALFLIDALFQLYAKVLSELTNLVDKNNEQVINEVCADKVKDLDKEKKCSKGLEALVKMNKENIEKIDDFYKLHDNFVKQTKAWNEFKEKISNIFSVEIVPQN